MQQLLGAFQTNCRLRPRGAFFSHVNYLLALSFYSLVFIHRRNSLASASRSALFSLKLGSFDSRSLSICPFVHWQLSCSIFRGALSFLRDQSISILIHFPFVHSLIGPLSFLARLAGRRLTPCSPGARCASAETIKPNSRAPVQQLLGTVVWHARFGLGILAHRSIGGLFSSLSFYIEARFTPSPHDSSQGIGLDSPPSLVIVSANSLATCSLIEARLELLIVRLAQAAFAMLCPSHLIDCRGLGIFASFFQ